MGSVLRARAPDGSTVAIKVIHSAAKETVFERFDREKRLLGELGGEAGFVPVIETGDSPRGPYIVMPFLGGGTLRALMKKGPLRPDDAVALGRKLARALGRAHALGIVHRDL